MSFDANIAFALELIALGLSVFLLQFLNQQKTACCPTFSKIVVYGIMAGAFLAILCTAINSYQEYKNPTQRRGLPFERFGPQRGRHGESYRTSPRPQMGPSMLPEDRRNDQDKGPQDSMGPSDGDRPMDQMDQMNQPMGQ